MKVNLFRKMAVLAVLTLCTVFLIGCEDDTQQKDEAETSVYTACITYTISKVPIGVDNTDSALSDGEIEAIQAMISSLVPIIKSESFAEDVKAELEKHEITDYDVSALKYAVTVEAVGGKSTEYNVLVALDNSEDALIIADVAGEYLKEYFLDKNPYAVKIEKVKDVHLK